MVIRALVMDFNLWVQASVIGEEHTYHFLISTIFTQNLLKFESSMIKILYKTSKILCVQMNPLNPLL